MPASCNIQLVILLINHQDKNGAFNEFGGECDAVVEQYCKDRGIACFDPVKSFKEGNPNPDKAIYRLGEDHHWSKLAHAIAAERLGELMIKSKLMGIKPGEPKKEKYNGH